MDDNIRKLCPNCSQLYVFQSTTQAEKNNLPLFLTCGHSMCEKCIKNLMKFEEPIECKVCHKDTEIPGADAVLLPLNKDHFYNIFPVNVYLVGELALQSIKQFSAKNNKQQEEDYYINLKALLQDDNKQGNCLECQKSTSKMCCQCSISLCDACFTKSHKNFIIFKNHVLEEIDTQIQPQCCEIHKQKSLDYYCKDCSKSICMDCMMVGGDKSCKNHDVASMAQINNEFMDELGELAPKVNDTFKRLTKTAVNVGNLLTNIANDTSSSCLTQTIGTIEHNFSKLFYKIQSHKRDIIKTMTDLKDIEKHSLESAKADIIEAIKNANMVMKYISLTGDPKKLGQINLSVLLEDAKNVINTPWYLDKDEDPKKQINVDVNEDLCSLVTDYVQIEGNVKSVYKLRSTAELGDIEIPPPPHATVYPPEMPKDVRHNASIPEYNKESILKEPAFFKHPPNYRAKSGSVSSLNSCSSDSSNKVLQKYADMYQKQSVQPVPPFADTFTPKRFKEGSQELVYISHIINPHNFYVQRANEQNLVKEMLRQFHNAKSLPRPSLKHAVEGKTYLAFNKVDNMWQRCRIVKVDRRDPKNPNYHVFCLDFGISEIVTIDKLRLLPPARVQSPHPLAINCALANCEPMAGSWTHDDSYLIQKIIDNKQAVIHIRRVLHNADSSVKLECDLTTFEYGVSIAHTLVFHERAIMPQPKLDYPVPEGLREKPKIFNNSNDFKEKAVENVYITHVVSPDKFYVRKHHLQSVYEKLCEDLEQEYGASGKTGTVYLPEVGMACAVKSACAGWRRGVVVAGCGRGRARVLLPDCGRVELLHYSALRHLHAHYTTLAALAKECHLSGVTPLNKKWNTGSVTLMQKYEEYLLELHVEDNRNRESIGVTLYCNEDPDNIVCLNNEMIKYKYAVSFGIFKFNKDIQEQVITNKHPLDKKPALKNPKNNITILKKQKPESVHEDDLEAKDKGPLRLEAKILHYQSPSLIYVSLVQQQKTFNELFEKIQKYFVKNKTVGKDRWKVGERCCTICNQSQTWRRAVILELEGETAKVFYSDFAFIESVPLDSLRELPSEFGSIGDAAIKCHLCGVIPAVGQEWPSLTKEFLKELLDAYSRVFITKLGNFKDKSMPVELWVYHTTQGGALEPNQSEWRCLNKKIIEQGLGVPDKFQEMTPSDTNVDDDEMLSFLNLTGSVRDWLQLEPMPMKPLVLPASVSDNDSVSSPSVEHDANIECAPHGSNVLFISDWLAPEPFPNKEFMGMPTYIDNDGIIYLHDVKQKDTLELISKALEVRFKNHDPKAKFVKWTVGEPCVAQYYLDNRFYRGTVLDVDEDALTCLIRYVDYGNEEVCPFTNIRKGITLHQIPIQAHKCILSRIRPVEKKWNRVTLDYIHKSIVEKECFVKITHETTDDVTPIELKYDKLWINDHLVDFEMAVYTDGSKPLIRKFVSEKSRSKREEEEFRINESDSGPDYIIEEDANTTVDSMLHESLENDSMHGKDWNKLVEDDTDSLKSNYIAYKNDYNSEFKCNICLVNDPNIIELSIIHDNDTNDQYEEMYNKVATEASSMTPINGIFENKACLALFPEDNVWYRAMILEHSESKNKIKVRFVDYGNIEVISVADVREIKDEWTTLPPATVSAKLHGIKLNPDIDISDIIKEYTEILLDKGPFQAIIVDYEDNIPCVELRNEELDLINKVLTLNNVFQEYGDINSTKP